MSQAELDQLEEWGACHGCHQGELVSRLWVVEGWYWHGGCVPVPVVELEPVLA